MSKYTKGPWVADFTDGSGPAYIRAPLADKSIAKVRWGCSCCEDNSPLTEEEIANRNILAASVELYEACLDVLTNGRAFTGLSNTTILKVRNAVLKAQRGK
jgi:hypothetical protein